MTEQDTQFLNRLTYITENNNAAQWIAIIKLKHTNKDLYAWLLSTTPFLAESVRATERIYCILNNITELRVCKMCSKTATFREYTFGYNTYCSPKCSANDPESKARKEQTCLKKYGTKHYLSTKEADVKRKATNLEKYGVENVAHMDDILERKRAGSLKKHGATHHMKTQESKDKVRTTNLEIYGMVNPLNRPEILAQNKEKFGHERFMCTPAFTEAKKEWLEKQGVINTSQIPSVQERIRQNSIEKYGVVNHMQKNFKNMQHWYDIPFITKLFIKNKRVDYIKAERYFNANEQTLRYHFKHELGLDIKNTNVSSKAEDELYNYITTHTSSEIIRNSRSILKYEVIDADGNKQKKYKELDLYLPEFNLAIEYDGIYYHSIGTTGGFFNDPSDVVRLRTSLKDKYALLRQKNIKFLNIWENEWNNPVKKIIWKSMIVNALNKCSVIYARECAIAEVNTNIDEYQFLEQNHVQGHCKGSSCRLGLFYEGILVALMTFGKNRYKNDDYIELYRFCNKVGYRVVGGASKLLAHFRKHNKASIISYANKRWSNGNLYQSLGFEFSHQTNPNYFYFKSNDTSVLHSRQAFQKWMLKDKLPIFDEAKTEQQNMFENKYRVIYDAGQLVYLLK